jgi:branched-subunit amino acid ABC-type transport system permease component
MERIVIKETVRRSKDLTSALLVLTFGIAIILENLLLYLAKEGHALSSYELEKFYFLKGE